MSTSQRPINTKINDDNNSRVASDAHITLLDNDNIASVTDDTEKKSPI